MSKIKNGTDIPTCAFRFINYGECFGQDEKVPLLDEKGNALGFALVSHAHGETYGYGFFNRTEEANVVLDRLKKGISCSVRGNPVGKLKTLIISPTVTKPEVFAYLQRKKRCQ